MNTTHKIIFDDSRFLDSIENNSIHLIVTSPPYWQLKDYDHDDQIGFNQTYGEYIKSLNQVWAECYRVLEPECRLCINIGDQFTRTDIYGRYKIIPIREEIIRFCESIGFDYLGAVIWQKVTTCNTSGGASIMGSFPYPRNGILKLDYEFILLFKKLGTNKRKTDRDIKDKSKIEKEEWKEWFNGHWYFPGEKQEDHIAMFPVELPKRLIKMFTFIGETVLDPFAGSGSTSAAAILTDRNSIGYEINKGHKDIIQKKLDGYINLANMDNVNIVFEEDGGLKDDKEVHIKIESRFKQYWLNIESSINIIRDFFYNYHKGSACESIEDIRQRVSLLFDKVLKNTYTDKYIDLIINDLKKLKKPSEEFKAKEKKEIERTIDDIVATLNFMKFEFFYTCENIQRINDNYADYKSVISREDREGKNRGLVKVAEVIDVSHLRISSGEIVRLSGIKPFEGNEGEALEYLNRYVLNEKIEVQFEESIKDEKTAYVKLKNKTHINAKLIKEGLADIDILTTNKFLKRFSQYLDEAKRKKYGYWKSL